MPTRTIHISTMAEGADALHEMVDRLELAADKAGLDLDYRETRAAITALAGDGEDVVEAVDEVEAVDAVDEGDEGDLADDFFGVDDDEEFE